MNLDPRKIRVLLHALHYYRERVRMVHEDYSTTNLLIEQLSEELQEQDRGKNQ